jgi:methylglutaconyl-CoA hydratase
LIGLIPATISPYVIRAIGERASKRYFTTGERFDVEEAHRLGLVSEVAAGEQLDQQLDALIDNLLANGPVAVRAAKKLVIDVAGKPIDDALTFDTCERIAGIRVSEEGQEGLTAFLQKRPPAWQASND